MLLVHGSAEETVESLSLDLPAGIEWTARSDEGIGLGGIGFGGSTFSSAQTTLQWRVVGGLPSEVSGTLRWPTDYNNRWADHAVSLLRVAEAGFVDGCPKSRPLRLKPKRSGSGVSSLDADPARLALLESDLWSDLKLRSRTRCRTK